MAYIKCDTCGGKIQFGSKIYMHQGLAGIYCSGECYALAFAEKGVLTDYVADNCYAEIFEDEE